MGLTKEVRDFFTNRINAVLDKRMTEVMQNVSKEKVANEAVARWCEKYGIENILVRNQKLEQKEEMLRRERSEFTDKLESAYLRATGKAIRWGAYDSVIEQAQKEFEPAIMKEWHPVESETVERINHMKDNVQATVLLATTEPKLVTALNSLLKNYGGEIDELLDVLPPTEG